MTFGGAPEQRFTEAGTYTYYVVAEGNAEVADPENGLYHYTSQMRLSTFPLPGELARRLSRC